MNTGDHWEPIQNMGIVVDLTAGAVSGFGGVVAHITRTDADLPRCNADDEGENDCSLTASDIKPDRSTGTRCQIEFWLIQLISFGDYNSRLSEANAFSTSVLLNKFNACQFRRAAQFAH
jgi:hypothetical protein